MPLVGASSLPRGAGFSCAPTRRTQSATRCVHERRRLVVAREKTTTTTNALVSSSPSTSSFFARRSSVSVAASASSSSSPSPLSQRLYSSLSKSNDLLPLAVVASALLALAQPSFFEFFKPQHYPPALGFLSFSIGLSLDPSSFAGALSRDKGKSFTAGTFLQWVLKPLIGNFVVANRVVPFFRLPPAVGTGIVLCSVVSGAQLSNYATFLAAPKFAPLSVLLTSASTAVGSFVTPALALLLLRTRLPPFDPVGVAKNLSQVVLVPIAAGISAQKMLPSRVLSGARPALSLLALLDTCCCVGSSLTPSSSVSSSSSSPLLILAAVMSFHGLCALAGSALASLLLLQEKRGENDDDERDERGFKRAFAVQGAMQSSLLALLLANTSFGGDPLVSAAAGVSTAAMSVFGFSLVLFWRWRDGSRRL